MARLEDKEKALTLRKQNQSYSQIKKTLNVSKSTLSIWLRDYPLSKERIQELRGRNEQRIERFRKTMREKKEKRLKRFYDEQKKLFLPLKNREIFLAGLFLYWGEGSKTKDTNLSVANTDPSIIRFFIHWLVDELKVSKEKLRIYLHLYSDMDIKEKIGFWSKEIDIPKNQFTKPYIKKNLSASINHKGRFGHGTCCVNIGDARLSERILMTIKAISDYYGNKRA